MKNIQTSRSKCPNCGKLLVSPFGNPSSPYLLVGEFPDYNANIQGVPFSFRQKATETRAGDILKDELTRVGIMINTALLTTLWSHPKDEKGCDILWHLDQLTKLFKDRTHVLLMGSDVAQAVLGVKIGSVTGTQVKVPGFSKVHFWAAPSPGLAFNQPIGELRLAFSRFAEDVNRKKK
jgi:uracil-DNA glycosylase